MDREWPRAWIKRLSSRFSDIRFQRKALGIVSMVVALLAASLLGGLGPNSPKKTGGLSNPTLGVQAKGSKAGKGQETRSNNNKNKKNKNKQKKAVKWSGLRACYLTEPSPLPFTQAIKIAGNSAYLTEYGANRVTRVDLDTLEIDPISAVGSNAYTDGLAVDDDEEFIYMTQVITRDISRIPIDGGPKEPVTVGITNGVTFPNGITFGADGRLFTSDFNINTGHRRQGGVFELVESSDGPTRVAVDILPVDQIGGALGMEFGPDGELYVASFWENTVKRVTVSPVPGGAASVQDLFSSRPFPLVTDVAFRNGKLLVVGHALPDKPVSLGGKFYATIWEYDLGSGGPPRVIARRENTIVPRIDVRESDGAIYAASTTHGNVWQVVPSKTPGRLGVFEPLFETGVLGGSPRTLNIGDDGDVYIATTSLDRVDGRTGDRTMLTALIEAFEYPFDPDDPEGLITLFTTSALPIGSETLIYSEFGTIAYPPEETGRITEMNLIDGSRRVLADGYGVPSLLRAGPTGGVIFVDQGSGNLEWVDSAGSRTTLVGGFGLPSGLDFDVDSSLAYVAEYRNSRISTVAVSDGPAGTPTAELSQVFATDLPRVMGIALDGKGGILALSSQDDGEDADLWRISLADATNRTLVARGLPTHFAPAPLAPGVDLMDAADVRVFDDGSIVISSPNYASLIVLCKNGACENHCPHPSSDAPLPPASLPRDEDDDDER